MTVWMAINASMSAILVAIVGAKLVLWHDHYNAAERIGMGLLGAGCLMTVAPILWPYQSPFQDWAGSLFRFGCAVYFIGRMRRHFAPV